MKNINQRRIGSRLKRCLSSLAVIFSLFLASIQTLQAQDRDFSGQALDQNGEPLSGVTVAIVGSSKGTVTDANGHYTLKVPPQAILKFSYLGYKPQVVNVNEKKSILNVTMEEDAVLLSETVVVAMDMRRDEKSLATAIQKVDIESMTESRDGSFVNMLAGKVANLQVISNGAGGSTRVILRGNNSLTGNNQALFVIDGVAIVNDMGMTDGEDLDYGNPANGINPDDIESVTVLKGANAAALYGSDAANGVIVITTKKATKKNGLGVSFSSNLQFNKLMQYPIYQNIYGAGTNNTLHAGYNYLNSSTVTYDPSLPWGIARLTASNYDQRSFGLPMLGFDIVGRNGEVKSYSPQPDNVTSMYKSGHVWTNNLSVDQLTDVLSVRFSYTNTRSDDMLENFNIINKNAFSLRTTTKVADYLSIDANARYNNEQASNRGFRNASNRNPLYRMAWMPRDITKEEMTPWKNPDGTSIMFPGGFYNPYWLLNELSNADEKHWLLADASLNVTITKDIKLRLKGALDMNNGQGWTFTNMYSPFDLDGEFQNFSELYTNKTFDALLSYNKRWKDFNLSASVGAWSQSFQRKKERAAVYTLLQPDDKTLINNGSTLSAWEEYSAKKKQAIFGTASVGYKEILYLDITGRNDWSSSLPAANRSYFYSSEGLSFVLTEAVKIPKNILSFAKLRASIATVGNDTGFDQLLDGYAYGNIYLGDMPWYQSDNTKKKINLMPEQTTSTEVGVDLRFWNNRINLDATYYTKSTKNQILRSTVSSASGYEGAMYNAGEVKNRGTELSLRVIPVKTQDFQWTTTLNWANNKSKVVSLADDMEYITFATYGWTEIRAVVGRSYGTLYGKDWKRDENGNIMVGSDGRIVEENNVFLGDISPDWMGGWANNFKIKNVDISFLFDFKKGGLLWSATAAQAARDGQSLATLDGRDETLFSSLILGESTEERRGYLQAIYTVNPASINTTVPYYDPRVSGINLSNAYFDESVPYWGGTLVRNMTPQDFWISEKNAKLFLYDASFIKLREIAIGYDFPKSLLKHASFFRTVKISAVGRNLAILYQKTPKGLDPEATTSMGNGQGVESGFNLPSMTIGFNFKATF